MMALFESGSIIGRPVWIGQEEWCRGVVCRPASSCHAEGNCVAGSCEDVLAANGTTCNDGNLGTVNDTCIAGDCIGRDLCAAVDCTSFEDDCHSSARCVAGQCYAGPSLPDGTPCNDQDDGTHSDVCNDGVCIGVVITTPAPTLAPTQLDRCISVSCPDNDECHRPFVCRNGQCFIGQNLPDGTTCNDQNPQTINDSCVSGVCRGTDACAGVDCSPRGQCELPGQCVVTANGPQCRRSNVADGTVCDDENTDTSGDRCFAGICVGSNACLAQTCTPQSQCHRAGDCIRGICSNPAQVQGFPCNDSNPATVGDACDGNGRCVGIDLCAGVTCPETTCRGNGTCVLGECLPGPLVRQGSSCDDGQENTQMDMCTEDGRCVGLDLCSIRPPCQNFECHEPSVCSRGQCIRGAPLDFVDCDDGDPGTHSDTCVDGICSGIVDRCFGVDCSARGQCYADGECDAATGRCIESLQPDNTTCNDGDPTTSNDMCQRGTCVGINLCEGVSCPEETDCLIRNTSLPGACLHGRCYMINEENGTPCDDGDEITDFDACRNGLCIGVDLCEQVICNVTSNPCTEAFCSHGRCLEQNLPRGRVCNDGDNRTIDDHCSEGVCAGIDLCTMVDCDIPSNPCEVATCFQGNCGTAHRPDGTECNDRDGTTVNDVCLAGVCQGTAVECPDLGQCHYPSLVMNGECVPRLRPTGTRCNDGNRYTERDVCARGNCSGVRIDACIVDQIDCAAQAPQCTVAGECFNGECDEPTPSPEGTVCDDGNSITDYDTCDGSGNCVGINLCSTVQCEPETQCRGAGTCTGGTCEEGIPRRDGTPCDDGNALTDIDTCQIGECVGVDTCENVVCEPSSQCVTASCFNYTCIESRRPEGYACDDGNETTDYDACNAFAQCRGVDLCVNVSCPAPAECSVLIGCSHGQCSYEAANDGTECDDNDPVTDRDTCVNGGCNGVNSCEGVVCPPQSSCVPEGTCVAGECIYNPLPDNASCSDNNLITYSDVCTDGTCRGRLPCMDSCVAWAHLVHARENIAYGLTRDGGNPGWNAGATSQASLSATSEFAGVQFEPAQTDKNLVVGLGYNDTSLSYSSIEYGIFFSHLGTAVVYESGRFRSTLGRYTANTAFSVRVNIRGEVEYLKNGAVEYTSTSSPTSDLVVEVSLFTDGAIANGFQFVTKQEVYCENIQCPERRICEDQASECVLGECTSATFLSVGTACDDENPDTINDVCTASHSCVGTDPCAGVICEMGPNCASAPTCYRGQCQPCDDLCANVQCPRATPCRHAATCDRGACVEGLPRLNGTVCDDGIAVTDSDECIAGECIGVNLCASVTCEPDQCSEVTCVRGFCEVTAFVSAGTPCDDGNEATSEDACNGAGVCIGVDPCADVTCPEPPQCFEQRMCISGVCSALEPLQNGAACSDGDPRTLRDHCVDGECVGSDPCATVTCVEGQCHTAGICFLGECVNRTAFAENTGCDDGDPNTLHDRCLANGECRGLDLCEQIECDEASQCMAAAVCFQGECQPQEPVADGTACDDGDPRTDNDQCHSGVCQGVDLCAILDCSLQRRGQCYEPATCENGICSTSNVHRPNGSPCDDSDNRTILDRCTEGACRGIDLCLENQVVCPPSPTCYHEVQCFNGTCAAPIPQSAGTPCDDGFTNTFDDVCDGAGDCSGVDPCANLECPTPSPSACHEERQCIRSSDGTASCTPVTTVADGTECNDGDELSISDVCERGQCVGTMLTCHTVVNGAVLFSNGCGGLNNSGARWSFNYLESPCTCTSRFGVTFGDFDGVASSSDRCAQMICSGGDFEFVQCDYNGVTVSTARRERDIVVVPFEYEEYICGTATPPDSTSVPDERTTGQPRTESPDSSTPSVCGRRHEVNWGFSARGTELHIGRGDEVRWTWNGNLPLNVRGDNGIFFSGGVSYNGTFTHNFAETGEFGFRSDVVFPEIHGSIFVGERVTVDTRISGNAQQISISPGDAPDVRVQTGGSLVFEWDGAVPLMLASSECGTLNRGDLFTSGANSASGTISLTFFSAGVIRYVVSSPGQTVTGTVTVASTPVATTRVVTTTVVAPTTTIATILPSTSSAQRTTPNPPGAFNLLHSDFHNYPVETDSSGNNVYNMDGDSYINIVGAPQLGGSFSFAMTVLVERGTSGYLFSFGDRSSSQRYVSLYASHRRRELKLFYRAEGSSMQHSLSIPFFVNNGLEMQVLLAINAHVCTVTVAGPGIPARNRSDLLVGPIQHCISDDCVLYLGARGTSSGGTRYHLTGSIYTALLYPDSIITEFPGSITSTPRSQPALFDLINPSVTEVFGQPSPVALGDGSFAFSGNSALRLTRVPRNIGSEWSASFWLRQGAGTSGYIFAKTDGSGSRRYYALYSSGSRERVSFYYLTGGSRRVVHFAVGLADGILHGVQLLVRDLHVVLFVDGSALHNTLIGSPIDDCGMPSGDCFFHVGARMDPAGGAYFFTGDIFGATFAHNADVEDTSARNPLVVDLIAASGGSPPLQLTGLGGRLVDAFRAVSMNFTITVNMSATSRGYVWAKTDPTGSLRRVALYVNGDRATLYYTTAGAASHQRVNFASGSLLDGNFHVVALAVSGTTASLIIDGTSQARALAGEIADCSAAEPNCTFYLGQRASTGFGYPISATYSSATLHYEQAIRG